MTITEFIEDDIRSALAEGRSLPYKLTLGAMSDYYKVSLTPVRGAIEELVQEGLVIRKDNGRLELTSEPSKARRGRRRAPAMPDPSQELDEQIRKDVVRRSLAQDEDYLREQATAEKYGVGRTLVRQVFSRLAGAGLLEHIPRCGWRVRPFNEEDMLNYLDVREMIELRALDLARPHFDDDELREMLEANRPEHGRLGAKLDFDMHDYWISRCGNRYIQEFIERYSPYFNTLFNYAVNDEDIKREMSQEHCDILERLIEHDWKGARKALSKHIRDQREAVTRMISYLQGN